MRFINSSLSSSLRLVPAAGMLTVLTVSAGHAQSTQLLAPPAGYTVTPTDAYPLNNSNGGFIDGPFTVAAGSTNVTFTATNAGLHSFEAFDNDDSSIDFPTNTAVVDTSDGSGPTGPLQINFSSGVSAFGLNVQDFASDIETFTFITMSGSSLLSSSTFVLAPVDNTEPIGKSVFLGAQAVGGQLITSVLISSASLAIKSGATSTDGSNDFYFGPLSTYTAPVPEASTTVSFGLLLALGLGGTIVSARKNMGSAKASTA